MLTCYRDLDASFRSFILSAVGCVFMLLHGVAWVFLLSLSLSFLFFFFFLIVS